MKVDDGEIAAIKAHLHPLQAAADRARELSTEVPSGSHFVGICGTTIDPDLFSVVNDVVLVRGVTNPPGVIHIARAADLSKTDYLAVSRYSSSIRAEIVILQANAGEPEFSLEMAWHTAALMKLTGQATLFCPASANCSWDTISAAADNSVHFRLLDDVPRQLAPRNRPSPVSRTDLEWVSDNWVAALDLRASRRFGLAFNMSYTWNHTFDKRIAVANLWCALEALFGDRNDRRVKAALVDRMCSWLSDADPEEIGGLYEYRCDAVHGRLLDDVSVGTALNATALMLRRSLVACIERCATPLPDWS